MLEKEREFFNEKKEEWRSLFPDKHVLVKGQELVGTFDSMDEALAEGARNFGSDSYLVRHVQEEKENQYAPALALGILQSESK